MFLGIALLNALLAFPLLYSLYKHYDDAQTPMDTVEFMAMAENGPTAAPSPIRYRLLTPLLVQAMQALPGYGIAVDYTTDAAVQKTFFHFLILNFLFTVAASALLFLWLLPRARAPYAWAASLLYLFSFSVLTANLIPMSDAACHLAIIAGLLCLDREGWGSRVLFAVVGIFGVLAKEAWILVLAPWIAVSAWARSDWKRLGALLWMLPGLAAFALAVKWMPQGAGQVGETYLGPEAYDRVRGGWDLLRVFRFDSYDRSFVFHTVLANLPLLAALLGWAWLRRKRTARVPMNPELVLFPLLLVFGIALGIGNNAARLAFLAFPAVALFQARVLEGMTTDASIR
jgi:hypothetical protein